MGFSAKYDGQCTVCKEHFDVGEEIDGSIGRYRHASCEEPVRFNDQENVENDPWGEPEDDPLADEWDSEPVEVEDIVLYVDSYAAKGINWLGSKLAHDFMRCGCKRCTLRHKASEIERIES